MASVARCCRDQVIRRVWAGALLGIAWGCSPGPVTPKPGAAPAPAPATPGPSAPATADTGAVRLPPIPRVVGPLAIRVVYPSEGQQLTARDSNFVYGSVGSGDATLT